jgi:hypothetical protein
MEGRLCDNLAPSKEQRHDNSTQNVAKFAPHGGTPCIDRETRGQAVKRLDEVREHFKLKTADTRHLRRMYLHRMAKSYYLHGAVWLHAHPADLWDTDEDERRGWTRMFADGHAEDVALEYAETGFYDIPEYDEKYDRECEARAETVGWARARQEMFFHADWIDGWKD